MYSSQAITVVPGVTGVYSLMLLVVIVALAFAIVWNVEAIVEIMNKVGALEVYRYFLRDTYVELDDCVVDIVVRKVNGLCTEYFIL